MSEQRTIVVADDEEFFRASLAEALGYALPEARVITVADGAEALAAIDATRVDLLITDVRMPVLDGPSLLVELVNRRVSLPVMVITAFGTPELERRVRGSGALAWLEKPIDVQRLIERARELLSERSRGYVEGVTLAGFVQLLSMERRSCTLTVRARERVGVLGFRQGRLTTADNGVGRGDEAALDVLAWSSPRLELDPRPPDEPDDVTLPVAHLLLEAMRVQDEKAHAVGALPDDPFDLFDLDPGAEPTAPSQGTAPDTRSELMSTVNESLQEVSKLDGFIGAAVADWKSGLTLGLLGGGARMDLEKAAAGNCEVVKAKLRVMESLGIQGAIGDMLITLDDQLHLIRPSKKYPDLFLYAALDKAKGNLGLARAKLQDIEAKMSL